MKFFTTELFHILRSKSSRRNLLLVAWFFLALVLLILVYSTLFHYLMEREGREFSWLTGVYWTLTVMTTLGFGDITFHSDLGRFFSMCVMVSGCLSLLVILPFTFIEFFYEPWVRAHSVARVPRSLPEDASQHVILTHYDVVTRALIKKLSQFKFTYVLVVEDLAEALRLFDEGVDVMVGDLTDPETYKKARVNRAALVATTATTPVNTSVVFSVRSVDKMVPIISTGVSNSCSEILKIAGSTQVFLLEEMMGTMLARRTNGGDAMSHFVGSFGDLYIAESTPASVMIGKTIREVGLREKVGITVLGVWQRGKFVPVTPETLIVRGTILLIAGTKKQLEEYDILFCIYNVALGPVVIVGGGGVGNATAKMLKQRDLDYRIIEKEVVNAFEKEKVLIGDASNVDVLKKAGIMNSPTAVITTNDSNQNLYLTLLIRHLRPDIQVISRAGAEGSVAALHEAGADFVMSYASMGANHIFNILKRGDILMVAEGLDLFKVKVPNGLVNKTLGESKIREKSGCNVVMINQNGNSILLPRSKERFPKDAEIVLIGNDEAEDLFLELF